ncbi:hypothetical protein X471_00163 [Bartonella bacilliformis str. Heidi Mejia]|uniref:DUF2087 domain-containing protein n=2 Tax=Bartonella bacilliformis TaxID=774 RepID=A1UT73_BARBK|nr:DUF2087 domain-containing protein [Bartonella bacilliformis]ABM45372.1 conserved hypothetical protein [Bartonella bacilliformis KC583]AMG85954.1 DUF2087 domain-containing protein [Bartonella bacilliformis]EKS43632.1 hypothetical protein BbINS_04210 [Bartonella bacilliformis INS]EYS89732.1 hypothetical protein X472_00166 [Bartonella bacilliformis San Pedro600-02]EYS92478.1 hypothetical protein X471_00163 [Bartonella bacilliformis str. Heidi Mejia]
MNLIRPGMGTENSSELISALLKMVRPNLVIEIGAGDSTIFILEALKKAKEEWINDKEIIEKNIWQERTEVLDPSHVPADYNPHLITIDDFTALGQSAQEIWDTIQADKTNLEFITMVQRNFFDIDDKIITSWGKIDFAWIDAGSLADDVRFVATLWPHIAEGGYLILHEPIILAQISSDSKELLRRVRTPLWEEIISRLDYSYEVITIPELHKYRQSGLGIIRKRLPSELVFRQQSLQEELLEMDEIPIRSSQFPIGKEKLQNDLKISAFHGVMANAELRLIYAAIILGEKSISEICTVTELDIKKVNKAVARLHSIGLIEYNEKKWQVVTDSWNITLQSRKRDNKELNDQQLETQEILSKIVNAFDLNRTYSEFEISKICSLFSDDYARLRRCLVDNGYLKRELNTYERVC